MQGFSKHLTFSVDYETVHAMLNVVLQVITDMVL